MSEDWEPDPRAKKALDRHIERMTDAERDARALADAEWMDAYGIGFNLGWEQGYAAGRADA